MVLGTSSGSGKSLLTAAICRSLKKRGEFPVPFKGQNMSNNAWIDANGGEMAYSQVFQAWASGIEPVCLMNPVLLKPQGDCMSEVIHLGESIGITRAQNYYNNYFCSGWDSIEKGLEKLINTYPKSRLVLEGAGSPVEVNLQKRDLTNLRLAEYLSANCILVADIERGGVFAQLIGTLALLKENERKLIKGIVINKFRGDLSLFENGVTWIQETTKIPVLGVMPWLSEIFPAEDSLDLLERKAKKTSPEIEIAIIKLPYLSNFSDFDPLEAEPTIKIRWVKPGDSLGSPDAVIMPGSKQTIKDLEKIFSSNLGNQLKSYARREGHIFGICGGMQMLGESLEDPHCLEVNENSTKKVCYEGLKLLPIKTIFVDKKLTRQRNLNAKWPTTSIVTGFELHHGRSKLTSKKNRIEYLFEDSSLGVLYESKGTGKIAGTYLHGIFDNGEWRRGWINEIRSRKGLPLLEIISENHQKKREYLINRLVEVFDAHIKLDLVLKS